MQSSISNAIKGQRTFGSSPSLPTVVYKQGAAGELEGGIVFYNYLSTWYESHPDYSFYPIDLESIDPTQLISYTLDNIEALFSGETLLGRSDWQLLEEVNPNSLGFIGFPTHEYDLSQSALDNFMSPRMFDSLASSLFNIILSGQSSSYGKIRLLYRGYGSIGVVEAPFPSNVSSVGLLRDASNWTAINITQNTLGLTLLSDALIEEGNPKTLYYALRCVNYTGGAVPPFIELPPSQLNIYDSGNEIFPNGILPQALLAYGDILEPNRLSKTIDRYREDSQIQSITIAPTGVSSELSLPELGVGESSQIVTTQTRNKQIILKLYIIQETKPPAPWYDKDPDETVTAVAKFLCYKNSKNNVNLLLALGAERVDIVAEANSVTLDTITLNGVTYYTAIHTFYFDVSSVQVGLTANEKEVLGIEDNYVPISTLSYIGSLDDNVDIKMRSMLFEFLELRFDSNKRSISRDVSSIIKTGSTIVVPTIGGSIGVGDEASGYILEPAPSGSEASGALYLSMKEGEVAPERFGIDFDFAFNASTTQNKSYGFVPALDSITLDFDTFTGALNKSGNEFRFIGGVDSTKRFTGYIEFEFDRSIITGSPDLTFELYLLLNNSEEVFLSAPTVTVVGSIETYQFNFDYTHTFTGSSSFDILETALLRVKAIDNADSNTFSISVSSGSTYVCESVAFDENAPTSDPQYLQTPPAPIQRFNRY